MTNPITAEQARELLDGTTPDWCVYSEPEVGLPPSLFAGKIGKSGFGPIEPLQGHDLNLAAAAPDLARTVIAQADELARLRADLAKAVEALTFYSCKDGCNDCSENERDLIGCGWTARTTLSEITHD